MAGRGAVPTIGRLETKREHYLPRFFLRHFTDDRGMLSYVSRLEKMQKPRHTRVENVAVRNCLYEIPYPSEEKGRYYFPNGIEKAFSSMEEGLGKELDWFLHTVLNMRPNDHLDDEDLVRMVSFVAVFIPHIVSRSPEAVESATGDVEDVLKAMRELDMDSNEKLRAVYREVSSEEKLDEEWVLDPRALAEQISLMLQTLPGVIKDQEVIKSSPLYSAVKYLRDCSMLVLTASAGHSFIGIDKPIRTVITNAITTWYYPLSSRVAVILADDGRHTFEKRLASCRQVNDFNRVALNDGDWNLVFCERQDYLEAYLKITETDNEQNR